tara:strand:+ start:215 stop:568 length:354 start_codon:yes stop_codon:yes gene_type:complete
MKKALAVAGILALSITPTASFADHLEPKESEIRAGGDLAHTNLFRSDLHSANLSGAGLIDADLGGANHSRAILTGANLSFARLSDANLRGITATNLRGCPSSLPTGWVCENNSLIQG